MLSASAGSKPMKNLALEGSAEPIYSSKYLSFYLALEKRRKNVITRKDCYRTHNHASDKKLFEGSIPDGWEIGRKSR